MAMHQIKGVYALLLGSGLSRAAQVPTGWDIVLDLIRRVALVDGQDCGDDPANWYQERGGEAPDYSVLLARLANTPAERSQIIRSYIEPSNEQRDLGLRLPTDAHRAIAGLVAEGHVRVIITTNFDRLLEMALAEAGVVPAVIDSTDAVLGTLPLVHNRCTIIKLHGDYIDARIKNTQEELGAYDAPINELLKRVFTEYGLIVCGWSGKWDTALVAALESDISPWFTTFWVSHREPQAEAERLIHMRHAVEINNMDADAFFSRLEDSVQALEDASPPETVSIATARAAIRRFIVDPARRIQLHDLVVGEANRLRRRVEEDPRQLYEIYPNQEEIENRLTHYERMTEVMRTVLANGCYWGDQSHHEQWVTVIERLAGLPPIGANIFVGWEKLRLYPALLAFYSAGIAAVVRGRYETLAAIFYEPSVAIPNTARREAAIRTLHPYILTPDLSQKFRPNSVDQEAAVVRRLWSKQDLWSAVREYVPDDDRFREFYDRFEYLVGLGHVDMRRQAGTENGWAPSGSLIRRRYEWRVEEFLSEINAEIQTRGANWPPLQGGLFGGSVERLLAAKQVFDARLLNAPQY
jgi:hypothetical protein